ncbi:MAG: hypothetical protein IPG10_09550 [Flavobacteriales bacterium]|nr:hypothetical protein [Flavobacteriales bacterium]
MRKALIAFGVFIALLALTNPGVQQFKEMDLTELRITETLPADFHNVKWIEGPRIYRRWNFLVCSMFFVEYTFVANAGSNWRDGKQPYRGAQPYLGIASNLIGLEPWFSIYKLDD